ncbi:MAG TPA: hypothetical protein PKX23_07340 [Verrucomicrobiota bacterium]|jgi:hypothetical protein|nr:hypothetical protein [Verrucomicrobiota bacterium]HRT07345.1 hypothetical protein [Candidatus Paceibacterota bacterium]HRT56272.1 hypothetical protein [Candidatus Paceibacterota bacterium]
MLTSHELLGFMSPNLAQEIILYAYEEDKPLYKTTLAAVAEARKLRPVYFERQPRTQRHAAMLTTLTRPALEMVTANLIRTWLLKKHNGLLTDFLDSLGIQHKEGVVDDLPETMEEEKLRQAVDGLLAKHPPEVVAVYLNAFQDMNEVEWPALKNMLQSDPRLQLGG